MFCLLTDVVDRELLTFMISSFSMLRSNSSFWFRSIASVLNVARKERVMLLVYSFDLPNSLLVMKWTRIITALQVHAAVRIGFLSNNSERT